MIICPTFLPLSIAEGRSMLARHREREHPIEIRIDAIREPDLTSLLSGKRPPVIITNRRVLEGGMFAGNAIRQRALLSDALLAGAEYVDVEFSWGKDLIEELIAGRRSARIIVSYHNRHRTPRDLLRLYRAMKRTGADILKIVTYAERIEDCKLMIDLLDHARRERQHLIGLCMGEHGEISRILGGKFGSLISFAPPDGERPTAEGQIGLDILEQTYRAGSVRRTTRIFGLLGNPVSSSIGYLFHNARFHRAKADAVYVNFLAGDLHSFLRTFGDLVAGLSVTMPFKKEIIPFIDHVDEPSMIISSVNTLLRKRGTTYGFNTDLPAIASALRARTHLRRKSVIVLGTGGTSRTMAFAAVSGGARTTIVGRDRRKAQSIAIDFGCDVASIGDLPSMHADILMNGTSVGMAGNPVRKLIPRKLLRRGMIVLDAVYSPEMTPLLSEARRIGAHIITGREIFEKQATLQSRHFLSLLR